MDSVPPRLRGGCQEAAGGVGPFEASGLREQAVPPRFGDFTLSRDVVSHPGRNSLLTQAARLSARKASPTSPDFGGEQKTVHARARLGTLSPAHRLTLLARYSKAVPLSLNRLNRAHFASEDQPARFSRDGGRLLAGC